MVSFCRFFASNQANPSFPLSRRLTSGKNRGKSGKLCLTFRFPHCIRVYRGWEDRVPIRCPEMSSDFDRLIKQFESRSDLLLRIARRYAPRPDLAVDVLQEVFMEFVRYSPRRQWDLEADISPLLCRMTRDCAIRIWKKECKHSSEALINLAEKLAEIREAGIVRKGPHSEIARIEALRGCIQKLPERSRFVVEEHYFNGISLERIAVESNGNAASLRKALFRIRTRLRRCVERFSASDSGGVAPDFGEFETQ